MFSTLTRAMSFTTKLNRGVMSAAALRLDHNNQFNLARTSEKSRFGSPACKLPRCGRRSMETRAFADLKWDPQALLSGARSAEEQFLIQATLELETDVFMKQDLKALADKCKQNVRLHKDDIVLQADLQGIPAVTNYFEDFVRKYSFPHHPIELGVTEWSNSAYVLSVEEDVTPTAAAFDHDLSEDMLKPCNIAAIYKYSFSPHLHVTDIYFYRQLTRVEAARKLKKPVDLDSCSNKLDISKYFGEEFAGHVIPVERLRDRVEQVARTAKSFSHMWVSGDPSAADDILAPHVRQLSLLGCSEEVGIESVKNNIKESSKGWESHSAGEDIAVSPDANKCFVHWVQRGEEKPEGIKNKLRGMNVLHFDATGKIDEILGFRSPFKTEDLIQDPSK